MELKPRTERSEVTSWTHGSSERDALMPCGGRSDAVLRVAKIGIVRLFQFAFGRQRDAVCILQFVSQQCYLDKNVGLKLKIT